MRAGILIRLAEWVDKAYAEVIPAEKNRRACHLGNRRDGQLGTIKTSLQQSRVRPKSEEPIRASR